MHAQTAIGFLLLLASCAWGAWSAGRASSRADATGTWLNGWNQIHVPAWCLIVAASVVITNDPLLRAALTGRTAPFGGAGAFLWPVIGAPAIAATLGIGGALIRDSESRQGNWVWLWTVLAGLTALLALGDRVRFTDGQLLMLGTIALFWWRSISLETVARRARERRKGPPGLTLMLYLSVIPGIAGAWLLRDGSPQIQIATGMILLAAMTWILLALPRAALWVCAATILGGAGAAAVMRSVGLALNEAVVAQRAGDTSWLDVFILSLASSPYLTGMGSRANEAALVLLLAAGVTTCHVAPLGPRGRQRIGFGLVAASTVTLGAWLAQG